VARWHFESSCGTAALGGVVFVFPITAIHRQLSPVISCVALEFHFDFYLSNHGDDRHLSLISVISVYQR
jgi:hypothetical protein